jgi:glycosyltransferase involved in cell wall biosynthesis
VYAQGPVSEGVPTALACLLCGRSYALKVVGDYAWEQGVQRGGVLELLDDFQKKRYRWRVELWRRAEYFVARHAARVIVPSRYLERMVRGWGVPPARVQVIYNAVSVPAVAPAPKSAGEQRLITAGRLVPWKGIAALIALMPQLQKKCPHVQLIIIGEGPQRAALAAQAQSSPARAAIHFYGQLSRDELFAQLRAADVFVLNSGYEGLSHVIIEAAAAGAYVIASDVGGNPELMQAGVRGDLCTYNDQAALLEKISAWLMRSDSERAVLVPPAAREVFLQQFALPVMIARTHETLTTLL